MAEEQNPKAKETSPQTRTPSAEYPEALVEKVLQEHPEVLRKVVEEFVQRGRGLSGPPLTPAQKELEEKAKLFKDGTAGPSREQQLNDSRPKAPKIADLYGDDPPEWARKRRP